MNTLADLSTQPDDFQKRWKSYYAAVEGRPPRETLLKALTVLESSSPPKLKGDALDLGCGEGRDTVELLRRGWRVTSIDGEAAAIDRLQTRTDVNLALLDTQVEKFENLVLPESSYDLINASFCLPFCPPDAFPRLWASIIQALRPNGLFCGQLFGDRDSWVNKLGTNHHTYDQVQALLSSFILEWFDEEDHPGKTALGEDKHWHIFNIVARKP